MHIFYIFNSRLTAAIPWTPDAKRISGDSCVELGQRVVLSHTLRCGRWVWRYFKGPSIHHVTIPLTELVTWPPGVAPEQNCTTQICCKTGSTHLPSHTVTGYTSIHPMPFSFPNTTTWNQLKSAPNSNIGSLIPLTSFNNQGQDP